MLKKINCICYGSPQTGSCDLIHTYSPYFDSRIILMVVVSKESLVDLSSKMDFSIVLLFGAGVYSLDVFKVL